MRYRVVSLDFDHTLTHEISMVEHYATSSGHLNYIKSLEAAFRANRLSTREFSDQTAHIFAGARRAEVEAVAGEIALLAGASDLVRELVCKGLLVVINTVGYKALLGSFQKQTGCADVSGALLASDGDTFTGKIDRYFAIEDKVAFAAAAAAAVGCGLDAVVAVGDGLSDLPIFAAVGRSVAFNADPMTKVAADLYVDGDDVSPLREALLDTIFGKGVS